MVGLIRIQLLITHLRIDLIGRRVRNEHSGLTAGIPIGLHQRKMELSNHG